MEKFNIYSTLYLRYENKPRIKALIKTINWIDPYDDIQSLIKYVLNFQSPEISNFGLDLYGIILNYSRSVAIADTNYFGFEQSDLEPLNVAPFFMGIFNYSKDIVMGNAYYKTLLKSLFLSAMYDGSLYQWNIMLQTLFKYTFDGQDRKIAAVRDGVNIIKIVSDIELADWEKQLLQKNILPSQIGISYRFEVQN